MGEMLYTVLAASGGWVNGVEVAIGAEIPLTDAEARYEIDLGTVAPTGREPQQPPPPPVLLPTDLVATRRVRADREVPVASLDAYLTREGGTLRAFVAERIAAITPAEIGLGRVDDTSDADKVAAGPIADAIRARAAPGDIVAAVRPVADRVTVLEARDGTWAARGANRDIVSLDGPIGGSVNRAFGRVGLDLSGAASIDLPRLLATTALSSAVYVTGAVDVGTQPAPALPDYWNQVLCGPGSVVGLYGKNVIPDVAPSDHMECGTDLVPEIHLPQFNSVTNPVVVFISDSNGTFFANSLGHGCMVTMLIQATLQRQCIGRTLTVINRAVGGGSWGTLNAVVSRPYMPDWYTDLSRRWIDYVADPQPDLVIVSLGMNVTYGGEIASIRAALATMAAWPKRPDIVFATNLVPRPSAAVATWGTRADQEARHRVAGLVRTFARAGGYGLLDFGRKQNIVQHGFDPTAGALRRGGAVSPGSGNVYVGTRECRHFGVRLAFDPSKLISGGPQVVSVQTGAGLSDVVQIAKSGSTQNDYILYWFTGADDAPSAGAIWCYAQDAVRIMPDANGVVYLRLEVVGGQAALYRETQFPVPPYGEFGAPIVSRLIIAHGGLMRPRIGENTAAPCVQLVDFDYGDDRLNLPGATSDQLWSDGSAAIGPVGGSGYNHHTNAMATLVYQQVLDASRFAGSLGASGADVGPDADWLIPTRHAHYAIPPLTASRTWQLPALSGYPHGQDLVVIDEDGVLGGGVTLTLVPRAGTGDTIPGYANNRVVLGTGASLRLRRGRRSNVWVSV